MKFIKYSLSLLALGVAMTACNDLERYPLDSGSSKDWFTTPTEYEMAVNDMYRNDWWSLAKEAWSDDYIYRKIAGPDIVDGTLNSQTNTAGSGELETYWTNKYKS
ncbi:MAG: RagB/SusD family nutrient uptake outer membrane protein, partial [Muribaculaceae bacterium]|nr:RagB/SusD family nutrient uptake outer membrane protein [Muribaculaceae bacterium]